MFVPRKQRLLAIVAGNEERLRGSLVTSGARAPVEQEPDHIVGAASQPAFMNGWVSHTAAGFGPVRFWKTSDGWVHLAGVAKSTAVAGAPQTTIFTLPVGYRPPFEQYDVKLASIGERATLFTTSAVDPQVSGLIRIPAEGRTSQGEVTPAFPFVFAAQESCVSLDGLSFRVF